MLAWELIKVLVLSGVVLLLATGCGGSGSGRGGYATGSCRDVDTRSGGPVSGDCIDAFFGTHR